ncbi:MAG: DUF5010 C-terminal domain-containing protein [Chloroflexota bacterium]|nr:DUF5010 C-terminal domain-containing protein [Chloroflexota bacterium]
MSRMKVLVSILLLTVFFLSDMRSVNVTQAQGQIGQCPVGAVVIAAGSTNTQIQSILAGNAAGTAFCFRNGTYNAVSITPDDNDQYWAETTGSVVFDGGGQNIRAFTGTFTVGDTGHPSDSGALAARATNATGVRLQGITFRNYTSGANKAEDPYLYATVDANTGWIMRFLTFENNDTALMIGRMNWTCARDWELSNTTFRNNRYGAFFGGGTSGLYTNNLNVSNGWTAIQDRANYYGVNKWITMGLNNGTPCHRAANDRLFFTNSDFYRNRTQNLWFDHDVAAATVENNRFVGAEWSGFMQEIGGSGGVLVRYNYFLCNGTYGVGGWNGANIWVVSSPAVQIQSNQIISCGPGATYTVEGVQYAARDYGSGINIYSEGRGNSVNTLIENNIFGYVGGFQNHIAIKHESGRSVDGTVSRSNQFYVPQSNGLYWWCELTGCYGNLTFAQWQSRGYDTSGSVILTGAQPTFVPPTPIPTSTPGGGAATATPTPTPSLTPTSLPRAPYLPTGRQPIPGRIEPEYYDIGGQGVAYNDTTTACFTGALRADEGVEIKNVAGQYVVGCFTAGEWLEMSVSVTPGVYQVKLNAGSVETNRSLIMTLGGVQLGAPMPVPVVAAWDDLVLTTLPNVTISTSGNAILRISNASGFADIDYIEFTQVSGVTLTPTHTPTLTLTPTPSHTPAASPTPTLTLTPVPSATPAPPDQLPTLVNELNNAIIAATQAFATRNASVGTAAQLQATAAVIDANSPMYDAAIRAARRALLEYLNSQP